MRVVLAASMFLLFGCGGAQKPAEGSASDTAALEPSSSPAEDTSPGLAASSDSKPATSHVAPPPAASSDAPPAAAPAAFHPSPGATGTIDGKPFEPKLARVSGPVQKDGRVSITLLEHADCSPPAATEGSLTLLVTWKDGYKTDLGSLKRSGKKGSGEIGFIRASKPAPSFKPTGTVTVVAAPTDQSATGKMKIDLQSGDYMLNGNLDVCLK
jgi:hypothetical protein